MALRPGLLSRSQAELIAANRGDWERDPSAPKTSNVYRLRSQHSIRISYRTFIELYRGKVFGEFTQRNFKSWDRAFQFVKRLPPTARFFVLAFGTNNGYPDSGVQWWTVTENTRRNAVTNVNIAQIQASNKIASLGKQERFPIAVRYHS